MLRPSSSWGRFGGAGLGAFGYDSGSEGAEDTSDAAGSFVPPSPLARDKIKLGPSIHLEEEEDAEVLKELERVRRAAYDACLAEVVKHLDRFLARKPLASFEDWISDLHPDNLQVDGVTGEAIIDSRFYAKGGEHRRLWNSKVPIIRQVQARSPECSPASSMGGSSGTRTPVLCRSAFSAPPIGHPYFELQAPPLGQPLPPPPASGLSAPPASGSYLLPSVRLGGDPGVDQLKVGPAPAHFPAAQPMQLSLTTAGFPLALPAWFEWPAVGHGFTPQGPLPTQITLQLQMPMIAPQQQQPQQQPLQPPQAQQQQQQQQHQQQQQMPAQQHYVPQCQQLRQGSVAISPLLRWQAPSQRAWSPPPQRGRLATAPRTTSVSPLRTVGLPGRAGSPLRTGGLPARAESPLRTGGLPATADTPLRTVGVRSKGGSRSAVIPVSSPLRTVGVAARADSPLRTFGLQGPSGGGGSAVIRPPRRAACRGGSFVWPLSGSTGGTASAAVGGA